MSEKIEGTIVLEGLVEGPVPPFPDAQEKLERWTQECGRMEMKLQMDGGHFSVMPTNKAMPAASLGEDVSMAVADSLSELLRMFPPLERRQVFSTLRSVEWRRKLEVRTIYAVGPDGRIATQQERSPCDTVAPPQPLSPKEMLIRGGIGLLVAAAILGISALFIDYPKQWRRMTASVEPATVVVQPGAFAPFLKVEVTGLDRRNGVLLVTLSRGAAYPLSDAELDALYEHPPDMVTSTAPAATAATASRPADFVGLLLPATWRWKPWGGVWCGWNSGMARGSTSERRGCGPTICGRRRRWKARCRRRWSTIDWSRRRWWSFCRNMEREACGCRGLGHRRHAQRAPRGLLRWAWHPGAGHGTRDERSEAFQFFARGSTIDWVRTSTRASPSRWKPSMCTARR